MTEAKTYPPVLDACCGSRMFTTIGCMFITLTNTVDQCGG